MSEMLLLNKWKKQDWSRNCAPCCVPYLSEQTRQAAGNICGCKYQRKEQTKVRICSTSIFVTKSTAMLSYCNTRAGFRHWIRFISAYSVMSSPLSLDSRLQVAAAWSVLYCWFARCRFYASWFTYCLNNMHKGFCCYLQREVLQDSKINTKIEQGCFESNIIYMLCIKLVIHVISTERVYN